MMRLINILFIITLVLPFIGINTNVDANKDHSYVIIVNNANDTSALSKQTIKRIFTKKMTTWPNGEGITPVDLDMESPIREMFSKEMLGKNVMAIKAFWNHQIFSGKGVPPVQFNSEGEVIDYVKNNKGAIAYVSARFLSSDVKKIPIDE